MLPISPTKLFIASPDPNLINAFTTQYPHKLELAVNDAVARQSTHVLIARDESLRDFVDGQFLRRLNNKKSQLLDYMTWNSPLRDVQPLPGFAL